MVPDYSSQACSARSELRMVRRDRIVATTLLAVWILSMPLPFLVQAAGIGIPQRLVSIVIVAVFAGICWHAYHWIWAKCPRCAQRLFSRGFFVNPFSRYCLHCGLRIHPRLADLAEVRCMHCGFDLRGSSNSKACPECNSTISGFARRVLVMESQTKAGEETRKA
jgi:DNA-directed RNA polymerase subunit RPC12/RpoP